MKRKPPDAPVPLASTGLSPRISATLVLTPQLRSSTPRLAAASSPRQAAALGRAERSGGSSGDEAEQREQLSSFALEPPRISLGAARSPPASRSPRMPPSPFVLEPAALRSPRAARSAPAVPHPPRSPRASQRSPALTPPAAEEEWCMAPTRRKWGGREAPARARGPHAAGEPTAARQPVPPGARQLAHGAGGAGGGWPDDDDDDGDPHGLLVRLSDKVGRNPQGKKSNQFQAVLKREGAVGKRNAQRGGPKR